MSEPSVNSRSGKAKVVICPYCGKAQVAAASCAACAGEFSPLSRQATQNEMGPWFVRDENQPFRPGIAYERLLAKIDPHLTACPDCGVRFGAWLERNHLGLPEIRPMPWDPDGFEED